VERRTLRGKADGERCTKAEANGPPGGNRRSRRSRDRARPRRRGGDPRPGGEPLRSGAPFRPGRLGAIAYLRAAQLYVVEVVSRRDRLVFVLPRRLARLYAAPQWSPDGRWIALADTLVPASGGAPCTPLGHGVALAWWPHGDLLAAVTKSGSLLLGGPGLPTRRLLPDGWGASGPAFDLRGRRLAVLRGSTSFIGSISVVDSRTGRQTKVYSSPSEHVGPPIRASWSADGGWLLFQTDTERSASLAADGVPLWAVRASGGRALMIEREVLVAPASSGPAADGWSSRPGSTATSARPSTSTSPRRRPGGHGISRPTARGAGTRRPARRMEGSSRRR
jgi:hypothetical protein